MDYRQEFENNIINTLITIPGGRYFIGLLIEESGFLRSSARDAGNSDDVFFREGERNVGQRVFELVVKAGFNPLDCMKDYGESCKHIIELQAKQQAEELVGGDVE